MVEPIMHVALNAASAAPSSFAIDAFQFAVRWVLVPAVLLGLLALATRLTLSQGPYPNQISNRMGLGLGSAIFILFVVINIFGGNLTLVAINNGWQDILSYVFVGVCIGVLIMFVIHILAKSRALPIFIALLSSTSLVGLYFYILTVQSRDAILLIVIGMLVGGLFYGMIFPVTVVQLRRGR